MLGIWLHKKGKVKKLYAFLIASLLLLGAGIVMAL